MKNLIFVDCEATGPCPGLGVLTEFGAVEYSTKATFHGLLAESRPRADNPAIPELTGKVFDAARVFADFERWLKAVLNGFDYWASVDHAGAAAAWQALIGASSA